VTESVIVTETGSATGATTTATAIAIGSRAVEACGTSHRLAV